ncbi:hypothetical protein RRF57_009159 [Xylaria bambusicola]|uniref:Uncharacterized protein n=1 Tax=Xylaria bambusicola TaxID=326684 RepID=A0AAN7UJ43_9PEZI
MPLDCSPYEFLGGSNFSLVIIPISIVITIFTIIPISVIVVVIVAIVIVATIVVAIVIVVIGFVAGSLFTFVAGDAARQAGYRARLADNINSCHTLGDIGNVVPRFLLSSKPV